VRNNPWTTFFYGIIRHQKFAGRSPPPSDSTAGPFLWPQAGRRPAKVFLEHGRAVYRRRAALPWTDHRGQAVDLLPLQPRLQRWTRSPRDWAAAWTGL